MSRSGYSHRKDIHLSQRRTCGRVDTGAGVYGGCYAWSDGFHGFEGSCGLGFKTKDQKPLEPCYKPRTVSQLCYAEELVSQVQKSSVVRSGR
jgi:hypothetical protein